MGLGLGTGLGRQVASVQDVLADLVGQDIVARSISLTQAAASVAVQLVSGARLKLGTGTTDYLTSNGAAQITAAGDFFTSGKLSGNGIDLVTSGINILNTGGYISWNSVSAGGLLTCSISAANAGATPATAAHRIYTDNALDATDWSFSIGDAANTNSLFAIRYDGSIVLPTSDSSGTPGNATINKATGRSAIAAAASSCVVTNSLVTAASHVFISPRTRDATGLLPLVTTIGAGSFTVSTSANCTANLVFDWLVVT